MSEVILGFLLGSIILSSLPYYSQSFPVHLPAIQCVGNESSVWDCNHTHHESSRECSYYSDAAVACQGTPTHSLTQ